MYMHVKAFEYMIQSNTLPCNVKFMIEGRRSRKCQSKTFVENNTENLKMMWFFDTGMISNQHLLLQLVCADWVMSKWKLLDLTVIYIPVYTVVQLPIQSIFWQNDCFFMTKTIILPFLVLWQCRRIISWRRKSWNGKSLA
jgi:hypothetical protein